MAQGPLRWVLVASLGVGLWACLGAGGPADPNLPSVPEPRGISLFLTGHTLGSLKPCGCSGGQLGGLDRRPALFAAVPKDRRLVIDTGMLVGQDLAQDQIKMRIIWQALQMIGYDAACLTAKDVRIGKAVGLFEDPATMAVLAASDAGLAGASDRFSKGFTLDGRAVKVNVQVYPADLSLIQAVRPGREDRNVTVAVLTGQAGGTMPEGADVVVCPADSDDPRVVGDANTGPLVVSVGRRGRKVLRLDVTFTGDRPFVQVHEIPVVEGFAQDPGLVGLYKMYQDVVRQSGLLDKVVKVPLSGDLEYAGTPSCKECHQTQYQVWTSNKHSKAYETLVNVGADADPECVACHVVGLAQDTGFESIRATPHLKDVGCEFCHGPGNEHNRTKGKAKMPIQAPRSQCLVCHTPEHSGGYAGHETEFLEKIKHWREPNAPGDVKER